MKQDRQARILEIIEADEIETQDELLDRLAQAGYKSTQATVSRDIRELKLTKIPGTKGKQRYALEKKQNHESSYIHVLRTGILSIEAAENIIVIKTVSGVAMAVAAALDNMDIYGLMGSIAGDDTIFLAVRSRELTMSVKSTIEKIIQGSTE
jgi:transcriptional regulator of arginine metabolism